MESRYGTIISKGFVISGDFDCDHDLRFDGRIDGDISVRGKVLTGDESLIMGNIQATTAEIGGRVTGDIRADTVVLLHSAWVEGNIYTTSFFFILCAKIYGSINAGSIDKDVSQDEPKSI